MKTTLLCLLALFVALLPTAVAQRRQGVKRLALRVTAKRSASSVVVDRGSLDLLRVGDRVVFFPRVGSSLEGRIIVVSARSAVIELGSTIKLPAAGTRGEVFIPQARKARRTPVKTKVPFRNKDEEYKKGQPLLTQLRSQRPEDRALRITGRSYLIGEFSRVESDHSSNSFFRIGTDVQYDNLFQKGGAFRIQAELDRRKEQNDIEGFDLLVQRFSYHRGGTRFRPGRVEFGRFLQHGMPELGVLDGVSYDHRAGNGERFGASVGLMPEPDDDFDSGKDFQLAAYYKWVAGKDERFGLGLAVQKTWHNGKSDRNLIITKLHYLPIDGWDFHGSAWVDHYESRDIEKGTGFELTQAILSLNRAWENGSGTSITYSRIRFPELLRNEFLPQAKGDLADQRHDRLALRAWRDYASGYRFYSELSGWDDELDSGGAVEMGLEVPELFFTKASTEIALFVSVAEFSTVAGGRVIHRRQYENIRWDLLLETANHHQLGFPTGANDILQHRVRLSRSEYTMSAWSFSTYAEGRVWDDHASWSVGLQLQKSF